MTTRSSNCFYNDDARIRVVRRLASAGEHRASYSESAQILLWDASRPCEPRHTLRQHKHAVRRVAFASNGALSGRHSAFLIVARAVSFGLYIHQSAVCTGELLVSLGCKLDSQICLWDTSTGALLARTYLREEYVDVTVSADGKQVIAVGSQHATAWDLIHAQPGVVCACPSAL